MLGDAAGVVDIIQRTAAAGLGCVGDAVLAGEARLVPELEGEADDRARRSWASIAATVEESTPPDMATAMVVVWDTGKAALCPIFAFLQFRRGLIRFCALRLLISAAFHSVAGRSSRPVWLRETEGYSPFSGPTATLAEFAI